jgi:hypothetical protein
MADHGGLASAFLLGCKVKLLREELVPVLAHLNSLYKPKVFCDGQQIQYFVNGLYVNIYPHTGTILIQNDGVNALQIEQELKAVASGLHQEKVRINLFSAITKTSCTFFNNQINIFCENLRNFNGQQHEKAKKAVEFLLDKVLNLSSTITPENQQGNFPDIYGLWCGDHPFAIALEISASPPSLNKLRKVFAQKEYIKDYLRVPKAYGAYITSSKEDLDKDVLDFAKVVNVVIIRSDAFEYLIRRQLKLILTPLAYKDLFNADENPDKTLDFVKKMLQFYPEYSLVGKKLELEVKRFFNEQLRINIK